MYYIFYFKDDTRCEPINRIQATSLIDATSKFAKLKKLSIDAFNNLLEQVYDLADESSSWDFEGGRPGLSSAYLNFWISSQNKANKTVAHFLKMNS